ncbi:FAD-dependent oxidoreductase [Metabacillus sp. HB246100]|uniref:FAD-dependent oxidoreductase n=1 Tax=Bacillus weihaiensis TaxID=1547283 RepID=UPI002352242E|nr:NAD(P)/FAD-dependent oxidoreductase [Bacillus weihaiensis]
MRTEVLIVGGGVGGLTTALKLASCGIDVTVVEQQKGQAHTYKGELLQPKSLQIFDRLQVFSYVKESGHPLHTIKSIEKKKVKGTFETIGISTMNYGVIDSVFNYGLMIPHERLKEILLEKAMTYPTFHYYQPARFVEFSDETTGVVKYNGETMFIQAKYIVGAEGRKSLVRKAMNLEIEEKRYDHHFLTVTFPRPTSMIEGEMIATPTTFLGLFPLPHDEVRSVYLIPSGEYKAIKEEGIESFYKRYIELCPALKGYVTQIPSWRNIQLMIPVQFHAREYSKDNKVIIGDAAHSVHPMAGEGMNLAIQDADALGDLICWMEETGESSLTNLKWLEKVRKPKVQHLLDTSHLAALAYSMPFRKFPRIRNRSFLQMEKDQKLHYKQMLNISGLGLWKESLLDRFIQLGLFPARTSERSEAFFRKHMFTTAIDYPWRNEGGEVHGH